jgi:hypothetical protein
MECRDRQPDKTHKRVIPAKFYRTQAKTVLSEVGLDPVYQQIALFPAKGSGHELHYSRVCIDPGEGLPVGLPPVPENQSLGSKNDHFGLWSMKDITQGQALGNRRHVRCHRFQMK